MLDFFCTYQDLIVGFIDTSRSATPPWNALLSPGTDPPYNKNPIPVAKNAPMNWFNFAWFNWYVYRCTTSQPFTNDEGTDNYVPDWEPADFCLTSRLANGSYMGQTVLTSWKLQSRAGWNYATWSRI